MTDQQFAELIEVLKSIDSDLAWIVYCLCFIAGVLVSIGGSTYWKKK